MENILGKDVTWYIYRKLHKQYLKECFDELYLKIRCKKGDILKLTSCVNHRQKDTILLWVRTPDITTVRGWIRGENYWVPHLNVLKTYNRAYPQYLQSTEVLNRVDKM